MGAGEPGLTELVVVVARHQRDALARERRRELLESGRTSSSSAATGRSRSSSVSPSSTTRSAALERAAQPLERARAPQHVGFVQRTEVEIGDDGVRTPLVCNTVPTFCRHNRFVAECPICSKGTVLDPTRRLRSAERVLGRARLQQAGRHVARSSRGPFVSAGPYDGAEIRLERVPGGLRLAAWRGGQIERTAPVLAASDVPALLAEAATQDLLSSAARGRPAAPPSPALRRQPGRTGELRDELRVELIEDGRVRVARWIMRPNRGWELQQAPVMLPPKRFSEALAAAARKGVLGQPEGALASGSPGE